MNSYFISFLKEYININTGRANKYQNSFNMALRKRKKKNPTLTYLTPIVQTTYSI